MDLASPALLWAYSAADGEGRFEQGGWSVLRCAADGFSKRQLRRQARRVTSLLGTVPSLV